MTQSGSLREAFTGVFDDRLPLGDVFEGEHSPSVDSRAFDLEAIPGISRAGANHDLQK